MKPLLISLLIARSLCAFSEPTNLKPGDIAITAFNFQDPDQFSFVTFVDLNPGTIIYFSDCGWKEDNSFREGEGLITYTVPDPGKKAFEVTTYPSDPGFQTAGIGGFFGFSVDGDQILAFQGSFTTPEFIFAITNNNASWEPTAVDNNTTALPPGLTNEVNAIALNKSNNSRYNCSLEMGNQSDLLVAMTNASNWIQGAGRIMLPTECFKSALPIHLVSFEVKLFPEYNRIEFITSNESNVRVYELQRSDNGVHFSSIGFLKAENRKEPTTYYFLDYYPHSCYYRLKEMDTDGHEVIFKSTFVSRDTQEVIGYCMYDLNGKVKGSGEGSYLQEEGVLAEVRLLDPGMYFVKLITREGCVIKKVYNE